LLVAELGDYQSDEHGPGYLSSLQLIPDQTEEMEKKISELHKLHKYVYQNDWHHGTTLVTCKILVYALTCYIFSC
jgi:hypothetical protein